MMSLKSFHIVFITLSTICAFGFSAWFFFGPEWESPALRIAGGIGSLVVGIALMVYGVNFLKKFKNIGSN